MDGSVGARLDGWLRARPWVADGLLAAALALVLAPASLSLLWRSSWPAGARVAVCAVLVLLHGTPALRRSAPLVAYGAACAALLVIVVLPDVATTGAEGSPQLVPPILLPSTLVWPVALHAVAARTRRPWPLAALVTGLVGAVLATLRLTLWGSWVAGDLGSPDGDWRLFVVAAMLAAVLAPWALGRFHGVRAEYAQDLRERARRDAVAQERTRIAREMHDVVAHSLAVMVRLAEGGRFAGRQDPAVAVEALAAVADTGRQALGDMRAVMAALRRGEPGRDDGDGTGDGGGHQGGDRDRGDGRAAADLAPQPTVDDLQALVDGVRATGLAVRLTVEGSPRDLDRVASLAAYRVVQESLTNAVKHAGPAASVAVEVAWRDGGLVIAVTDDGGGPAGDGAVPVGAGATGGLGLLGMHERVTLAGGRLSTGRREDGAAGFAVRVSLPYPHREGAT